MHFFGDEPGDGFFIRGDISYSTMTMDLDDREVYEESGYGLLVGGGYGWAITDETRILLSLLVKQVDVGDSDSQSVSFLIGGLW